VRSSFWADPAKDEVLRKACQEADAIFVNAGPIGREAANVARSERSFMDDGVASHPGDQGMKALADVIVQAVLQRNAAAPAVLPGMGPAQHPFLYAGELDTRKPQE
jgi:hypothetical protein